MIERRTNDFILALSTRRKERKGVVDVTLFLQYWAHDITVRLFHHDLVPRLLNESHQRANLPLAILGNG